MSALDAMRRALEEYPGRNPQQLQARKVCEGVLALAATITQQQGGEQEAGGVVLACLQKISDFCPPDPTANQLDDSPEMLVRLHNAEIGDTARAGLAALRTKQPAASEGDVSRIVERVLSKWEEHAASCDAESLRLAKIDERTSREIARDAGQYRSCIGGLHDALANIDTSKQAAGEAVACPCGAMRNDEEGPYPINRQATLFRLDCVDRECRWAVIAPTAAQALLDWNRRETTPPRHPADEGAVCAEDLRWLDDIAADLKQAGGSTNNMRLIALNRAIAALQAGTP